MGRYKSLIQHDHLFHRFHKELNRNFGQENSFGRLDHPEGIFLMPKQPDTSILSGKSFKSFERFLTIVQASSSNMDGKIFV